MEIQAGLLLARDAARLLQERRQSCTSRAVMHNAFYALHSLLQKTARKPLVPTCNRYCLIRIVLHASSRRADLYPVMYLDSGDAQANGNAASSLGLDGAEPPAGEGLKTRSSYPRPSYSSKAVMNAPAAIQPEVSLNVLVEREVKDGD